MKTHQAVCLLAFCWCAVSQAQELPPGVIVAPVLETKISAGCTTVWTAAFPVMWRGLLGELKTDAILLKPRSELTDRLNAWKHAPDSVMPKDGCELVSEAVLTAWSTRALFAAKLSGLRLDGLYVALERAQKFALSHRKPSGAYEIKGLPGGAHPAFAEALVVAALTRTVTAAEGGEAERRRLLDHLGEQALAQPLHWDAGASLHEWFLITHAMHEAGGEAFRRWNRDVVLPSIIQKEQPFVQWQHGPGASLLGNPEATTRDTELQRLCIAALVLEAPYRLPQRRGSVDGHSAILSE